MTPRTTICSSYSARGGGEADFSGGAREEARAYWESLTPQRKAWARPEETVVCRDDGYRGTCSFAPGEARQQRGPRPQRVAPASRRATNVFHSRTHKESWARSRRVSTDTDATARCRVVASCAVRCSLHLTTGSGIVLALSLPTLSNATPHRLRIAEVAPKGSTP